MKKKNVNDDPDVADYFNNNNSKNVRRLLARKKATVKTIILYFLECMTKSQKTWIENMEIGINRPFLQQATVLEKGRSLRTMTEMQTMRRITRFLGRWPERISPSESVMQDNEDDDDDYNNDYYDDGYHSYKKIHNLYNANDSRDEDKDRNSNNDNDYSMNDNDRKR